MSPKIVFVRSRRNRKSQIESSSTTEEKLSTIWS